jgi:hypothetical protein
MSKPIITFHLKKREVHIPAAVLSCLDNPKFIEFLYEREKKILLIGGGATEMPHSVAVKNEVYSVPDCECVFCSQITEALRLQLDWEESEQYRAAGEHSPRLGMMIFDLKKSEKIVEQTKKQ